MTWCEGLDIAADLAAMAICIIFMCFMWSMK